jgi:predicted dithiol-disulfide oxidoreductase (DUF899 family)
MMTGHAVVSRQEWLDARMAHLAKEKALTRRRDALLRERMDLPWERVEKKYVFETVSGRETLAEMFGDQSQLLIYHFMFGPEWEQGCPSCSLVAETINANLVHLTQRDVAFAAVSRAPLAKIEAFRKRMGWTFPWASSFGSDFNFDYGVSFTPEQMERGRFYNFGTARHPSEEAPGLSAFYKDEDGEVFHTYSSYGRGVEGLLGVYSLLDMAPKGRDEAGLSFPMAWVRHHDRYETQAPKRAAECCSAQV